MYCDHFIDNRMTKIDDTYYIITPVMVKDFQGPVGLLGKTKDFKTLLRKMSDSEYNNFTKLESASPMWKEHEKITKSIAYSVDSKTLESRSFQDYAKGIN